MSINSTKLAINIVSNFKKNNNLNKIKGGEIALFRSLLWSFKNATQKNVYIEEHHGTNHQVTFTGNGTYARSSARCELSDLLLISFNSREARLTYLQAKYENTIVSDVQTHKWKANLEQWFLLNQLPLIKGYGKFNPPADLLNSAKLKSIGSFGFFHKDLSGDFDLYYASAEHLSLPITYTQRSGKLFVNRTSLNSHLLRQFVGFSEKECLEATSLHNFLVQLYNLQVGTPIHINNSISRWIISNLKSLPNSSLVNDLLKVIDINHDTPLDNQIPKNFNYELNFGAKKILLIRVNDESIF